MKVKILSAGVVILRREGDDWLCLLLRAYQHWDSPKGQVEDGETPLEGALREVEEEAGITDLHFDWGKDFIETGPYAQGKVARYYLARTEESKVVLGISPELGRPEHHEYRWVKLQDAFEITTPRVRKVLGWVQRKVGLSN